LFLRGPVRCNQSNTEGSLPVLLLTARSIRAALQALFAARNVRSNEHRVNIGAFLRNPRNYERQIDLLHERHLFTRQLYTLEQDGVSLATLVLHRSQIGKLLARSVSRGRYLLQPAALREIRVEGKLRRVYALRLTDQIVLAVVADLLAQAMSRDLSPRLYSYRKGFSWFQPVVDFARYVRMHRRSHPDARQRGLYILRRDIEAYFDSIPVGRESPLWSMLRNALTAGGGKVPDGSNEWSLIEKVVRPEVLLPDGAVACPFRGIPTGQPIASVMSNLFLSELDKDLEVIPGAFYARYADDLIFAHPDPGVTREVDARIDRALASLHLVANESKRQNLYLTAAGRMSAAWAEAKGTTVVRFLGMLVLADGTVALGARKRRGLLRDLERIARRTARALPPTDGERVGRVVCSVINSVLTPRTVVFQQPSIPLLLRAVTNRGQLAHLDYSIARIVVRTLTGLQSVRAFRQLPYRKIRGNWGLVSLLHARNRWRSA
jgi:hypothetical protein